jgi:hypothetical protein
VTAINPVARAREIVALLGGWRRYATLSDKELEVFMGLSVPVNNTVKPLNIFRSVE